MKLLRLFAIPVLAAASGCTVNHYHYHGSAATTPVVQGPAQKVMADRLVGIHAAMEIVANNLANINTLAYKAHRVTFHEGDAMPHITTDWTSGSAIESPGDLSLFIAGEGLFQIEVEEDKGGGMAYTRGGQFFVSSDGEIVMGNAEGSRLAGGIKVPMDAVSINVSSDGIVAVFLADSSMQEIGQIELHHFACPEGLERGRSGFYFETDASGPATAGIPGEGVMGTIAQGLLECSNVSFVSEMVELTMLTRWSNGIKQQLGLATTPLPPLDFPLQARQDEDRLVTWLQQVNAATQAAP